MLPLPPRPVVYWGCLMVGVVREAAEGVAWAWVEGPMLRVREGARGVSSAE